MLTKKYKTILPSWSSKLDDIFYFKLNDIFDMEKFEKYNYDSITSETDDINKIIENFKKSIIYTNSKSDISETETEYVYTLNLAGCEKSDIICEINESNELIVKGESKILNSTYHYRYKLPLTALTVAPILKYENGIVTIKFTKKQPNTKVLKLD